MPAQVAIPAGVRWAARQRRPQNEPFGTTGIIPV
jgi:hypothetical protein